MQRHSVVCPVPLNREAVLSDRQSIHSRQHSGWLWLLTAVAVAWILFWQLAEALFGPAAFDDLAGAPDPDAGLYGYHNYFAYAAPAVMLILQLGAKQDGNRASRIYLLFFLIGICSLAAEASWIGKTIASQSDQSQLMITFQRIPNMLCGLLVPLVLGIGCYIILADTGANADASAAQSSESLIARLTDWLTDNDAPEFIQESLIGITNRLSDLESQYARLSDQTQRTNADMSELGHVCQQTSAALLQIQQQVGQTSANINALKSDIQSATSELGQLGTQVDEMGGVLDQFAEVACHEILKFAPATESIDFSDDRATTNGSSTYRVRRAK